MGRKQQYIESLWIAKSSENDAIKTYLVAMDLADNPVDRNQLAEILNDENEHDAIVTDILAKALTGIEGKNQTYFATDEAKDAYEEFKSITEMKSYSKAFINKLNLGLVDEAFDIFDELCNYIEQNYEIETDGGDGSGNWNHEGRVGKVGGSKPTKGKRNKKKKAGD